MVICELPERTNRVAAKFLQIDCEIALTFSGIALKMSDEEKRRHLARTARKAYDTIMRLRKDFDLTDSERDKVCAKLQRLKTELQILGQGF